MLREILSITGKPGLFRLISQAKQSLIVEELGTGKRLPVHARDKVVSLGDIAMYTESGDTPLGEILDKVFVKYDGKPIEVKVLVNTPGALKEKFAEIVTDFDRVRVHDGDIKKLFQWYNILIANGFDKFAEEEKEETKEEPKEKPEAETKDAKKEAKPAAKAPAKKVSKPKAPKKPKAE